MPTYEYRCPEGHKFDAFQRMSDPPEAECPECGKKAERLISAGAGFLFKGEGFYITDYRSDSYRKAAEAEGKKTGGDSAGGAAAASANGSPAGKKDGASGAKKDGASSGSSGAKGSKPAGSAKAPGSGSSSGGSKD